MTRLGLGFTAFATIGALALGLTVASAAPAGASQATEQQGCPGLTYDRLLASAADAVATTHPDWNVLTSVWASDHTTARSDLRCIDTWAFRFGNLDSPEPDREVQLDPRTGAVLSMRDDGRWAPLPADAPTPYEALEAVRARGYADTVSWFDVTVEARDVRFHFVSGSGTSVEVSLHDGVLGEVRVSGLVGVDLPESVIADNVRYDVSTGTIAAYTCPAHHPYLWKQDFGWGSQGTIISTGFRPGTPGVDGALQLPALTSVSGLASGWPNTPDGITLPPWAELWSILALCTDDPAEAFSPPDIPAA